MTTEATPGNVPLSDLLGLGAMLPACWTLAETLAANQTTSFGHLWFTNPKNTAWEPLYRRNAIDRVLTLQDAAKIASRQENERDMDAAMAESEAGWDGHKGYF